RGDLPLREQGSGAPYRQRHGDRGRQRGPTSEGEEGKSPPDRPRRMRGHGPFTSDVEGINEEEKTSERFSIMNDLLTALLQQLDGPTAHLDRLDRYYNGTQ